MPDLEEEADPGLCLTGNKGGVRLQEHEEVCGSESGGTYPGVGGGEVGRGSRPREGAGPGQKAEGGA